jgi:hypothetical protein
MAHPKQNSVVHDATSKVYHSHEAKRPSKRAFDEHEDRSAQTDERKTLI